MESHSEHGVMAIYAVQALLLCVPLFLIARRNGRIDIYSSLYIGVWALAVIVIRFKYGVDQTFFYSSDQQAQYEMYERMLTNGLLLSPQQFIADRYLIIVPVRFLAIFGIDPVLATKFFQAICLVLLYRICSDFLEKNQLAVKFYHAVFFAGPLFVFLSTLGLRDLQIALAATYFFLGRNIYLKQVAVLLLIPLRPHLAVALIVGWVAGKLLYRHKFKRFYLTLFSLTFIAFALGAYSYVVGRNFREGNAIVAPEILDQDAWWRFFSNLVGLQFLTFDSRIVDMQNIDLLALRLIFIDSFLIPLSFIFTLLVRSDEFSQMRVRLFVSFSYFLGLAAQTDFNSTRQNLPFLSTMGVLALLGLTNESRNDDQSTGPNLVHANRQ